MGFFLLFEFATCAVVFLVRTGCPQTQIWLFYISSVFHPLYSVLLWAAILLYLPAEPNFNSSPQLFIYYLCSNTLSWLHPWFDCCLTKSYCLTGRKSRGVFVPSAGKLELLNLESSVSGVHPWCQSLSLIRTSAVCVLILQSQYLYVCVRMASIGLGTLALCQKLICWKHTGKCH